MKDGNKVPTVSQCGLRTSKFSVHSRVLHLEWQQQNELYWGATSLFTNYYFKRSFNLSHKCGWVVWSLYCNSNIYCSHSITFYILPSISNVLSQFVHCCSMIFHRLCSSTLYKLHSYSMYSRISLLFKSYNNLLISTLLFDRF